MFQSQYSFLTLQRFLWLQFRLHRFLLCLWHRWIQKQYPWQMNRWQRTLFRWQIRL
jgi:hypothetical protein